MNTAEFLKKILPSAGLYVIGRLTAKGMWHQVCESVEEAAAFALQCDAQGVATYHAVASYRERQVESVRPDGTVWKQVRTHKNVQYLRSFFLDLDVKPGNPAAFESQEDACEALRKFCDAAGLSLPLLVSSGTGVHCYWVLAQDIIPAAWKRTADGLKLLCASLAFKADPAVTGDLARILRPVGTWNRKDPQNPRAVEIVYDADPVEYAAFDARVSAALKAHGVKPPEGVRQVVAPAEKINQQFDIARDFPPCSITKVAEKCAQVRSVRDSRGLVSEPAWYSFIQLACHSTEGDATIHEWSNGHASYSAEKTARKITQIRSQSLGPTLCTTFESRVPGGCDGCPFKGKISSPAQLGTYIVSAPAPTVQVTVANVTTTVTLPPPPNGYIRGEDGGIYVEEDGVTTRIYEFDCFPVELAHDEQLGYETMRWRHWLPQEGWKECTLRSSLVAKPADFMVALIDNHIQPLIKAKFIMYGDAYIRRLRSDTKLRQLFKSQGWKHDDTEFVLGDKLYRPDEVIQAGFSHGMAEFLAPFHAKGSIEPWRTLTEVFDHPGFEPHAFMLLLAFAAPLLKLAGREGSTINALGESGVGKSTMAQFMSSVYGSPKGAWVGRDDTKLARMQRLGAHYNLPVYMDEATTIDNKDLRDLIYSIPTGKNRTSMKADYTMRPGAEWVTLFVTSTNNSLQTKLQLENQNAEAETLRLFEFKFPRVSAFAEIAKIIPSVIQENYGVAGPIYIQYLVQNRDTIRERLRDLENGVVAQAERGMQMNDKERFWSQIVALAMYGGELARAAGVISFDPRRIHNWLLGETQRMRSTLDESVVGPVAILANFLNEHVGERLVVNPLNADMSAVQDKPYREVSQRYEPKIKTLWISRKRIKFYMDKNHFNFAETETALIKIGVLTEPRTVRTLGAGTNYASGPTPCWQVDVGHAEMEGVAV